MATYCPSCGDELKEDIGRSKLELRPGEDLEREGVVVVICQFCDDHLRQAIPGLEYTHRAAEVAAND